MSRLDKLIDIQEQIDEASYKIAKFQGEEEVVKRTLKNQHKCDSTKTATKKIRLLRKTLADKKRLNQWQVAELQEVFNKNL